MATRPTRAAHHSVHTATAIGDPVLVRVDSQKGRMILIAQDASYETANCMRLLNVRCVCASRGPLARLRRPTDGRFAEIHLRRTPHRHVVCHPNAQLLAPPSMRSYPQRNLSALQYQVLSALRPARVMSIACRQLAGPVALRAKSSLLRRVGGHLTAVLARAT